MNISGPSPDRKLQAAIKQIVEQADVSFIVETGTHHGNSTVWLSKLVPLVYTIEINREYSRAAAENFNGIKNIRLFHGSSDEILQESLAAWCRLSRPGSPLIILDAHWNKDWPLLNELVEINRVRATGQKMTVLIDDFFVPLRANFVGCYGGLRSDDSAGREVELTPCGYNPPFSTELDKLPHLWYPTYPEPSIGYAILSDYQLDLGPHFERTR